MSRSFSLGNHRVLLAVMASLLLGLSCAVASASAASAETLPAECGDLQATMNDAAATANHGEGDVIVLNGLCKGSFTLPGKSSFSIEGAPGTPSGFDGTGVSGSLLSSGSEVVGAMTLSDLVFEHSGETALFARADRLTLSGDTFLEDTELGADGGAAVLIFTEAGSSCASSSGPVALRIVGSTFREDKVVSSGEGVGGALQIVQDCTSAQTVLEEDIFEGDTVEAPGTDSAFGGALDFFNGSSELPAPIVQRGNVFDSNRVVATSGTGDYGGGGEWLEGASLTSIGDRFSRNAVAGTSGKHWSWGGALGILNTGCNSVTPTESTLEDAVVAGNSIGAGEPADLGGAGIYIGCSASPTNPNHLSLLDSTVTQNTVPSGGVAGIDGNSEDHLAIENSIVAGDIGGNETGGFNGPGGSLTATFSDICASAGSSEPLPGAGDICANPLLADNGNPASFDVHETASSPTIDAGSNALVPSGLTTDAFGTPRILAGHAGCSQSFPAVVDIGAAEFQPAQPSCPAQVKPQAPVPAQAPVPGLTHFVSLEFSSTGAALRLSCLSSDGLGCSGTIFVSSDEMLQGKKVIAVSASNRTEVSVTIAQASFSLAAGQTSTVQVKLNSTGLALLRRFHAISALVLANEAVLNGSPPFIFLFHSARFSEPTKQKHKKHKSKKHKSRHHKPRHPKRHH